MRGGDLADQPALRQIDHRDRCILLVLRVEAPAVRRDRQPVRVGRAGRNGVHQLARIEIDERDDSAVLAREVEQTVRPDLQPMRRDVGCQIDIGDVPLHRKIHEGEQVAGIGIAPMNAVAVDRHVGGRAVAVDQQLVRHPLEVVEDHAHRVADRIEKQHLAAHLVDGDEAVCWFRHHCVLDFRPTLIPSPPRRRGACGRPPHAPCAARR
jgi:hypothetical protein